MKILIIDNFDSFTWNLFHYVDEFVDYAEVVRVNEVSYDKVLQFDGIILSPGPGLPDEYLAMTGIIEKYHKIKPILGICLGHQAICRFFGAKLINLDQVHHGVQRNTNVLNEDILFQGIPAAFPSGRYHSWLVDNEGLPSCLKVIASDEGMIMAVAHTFYNVKGLQFHPESVMTPHGKQIIKNWLISVH